MGVELVHVVAHLRADVALPRVVLGVAALVHEVERLVGEQDAAEGAEVVVAPAGQQGSGAGTARGRRRPPLLQQGAQPGRGGPVTAPAPAPATAPDGGIRPVSRSTWGRDQCQRGNRQQLHYL